MATHPRDVGKTADFRRMDFIDRDITRGGRNSPRSDPPRVSRPTTPHDWHLEQRCPYWLEQGQFNWDWPNYLHSERRSEIVSCKAQEIGWSCCSRTGGSHDRQLQCGLIQSVRMPQRLFFRLVLPAMAGLLVGFLALAWASTSESTIPVWVVSLFSPGLKIAELAMPEAHESLAWTFGWFLRISIGVNAIFYLAIFALIAHLVDRRGSRTS